MVSNSFSGVEHKHKRWNVCLFRAALADNNLKTAARHSHSGTAVNLWPEARNAIGEGRSKERDIIGQIYDPW